MKRTGLELQIDLQRPYIRITSGLYVAIAATYALPIGLTTIDTLLTLVLASPWSQTQGYCAHVKGEEIRVSLRVTKECGGR